MRIAEREHLLLLAMHQVVCDGWSLGVLVGELPALYDAFCAGKVSPLAPLPIQFADFASWQRHWQSHPDIIAQLAYWREQLRDPLPAIELAPPARGGQSTISTWRGGDVALSAHLSEAFKSFSSQEGGTLFMALVAALKTLLNRYLGQEDLRVATNVANRNRPGTEGLIGPLANTSFSAPTSVATPTPER